MQPESSHESPPEAPVRSSASVLFDIVIAPGRAFTTIAVRRPWLLATLIIVGCNVAGNVLALPAMLHIDALRKLPMSGAFADALNITLVIALTIYTWSIIASVFANVVARGKPEYWTVYRTFFALAANAAIPSALGALAGGIAVRLHPPESFHSLAQLVNALPISLAVFASSGNDREVIFLSDFDLTTVWSILLVAYGAHAIGRINLATALAVPFSIILVLALIPALFH